MHAARWRAVEQLVAGEQAYFDHEGLSAALNAEARQRCNDRHFDFRVLLPFAVLFFPNVDADLGSLQVNVRRFRSESGRIGLNARGQMAVRLFERARHPGESLRLPLAPLLLFLDPHLKPLKAHAIPW